jgi:hypothetical protein
MKRKNAGIAMKNPWIFQISLTLQHISISPVQEKNHQNLNRIMVRIHTALIQKR